MAGPLRSSLDWMPSLSSLPPSSSLWGEEVVLAWWDLSEDSTLLLADESIILSPPPTPPLPPRPSTSSLPLLLDKNSVSEVPAVLVWLASLVSWLSLSVTTRGGG